MKVVGNSTPSFTILYPIGTKIRWKLVKRPDLPWAEILTVTGYAACVPRGCQDCDGRQYLTEHDPYGRCHYRKPDSSYGLGYWEKVE